MRGGVIMRMWILRGGAIVLGVALLVGLLWTLAGSGHNPNHDIDMAKAREAADRVHPRPKPGFKYQPGAGG
jgi:hypothetical protein